MLRITQNCETIIQHGTVREPSLLKLHNGDLLLTFHVENDVIFAKRDALRSSDGGQTWRPDPPRAHREQAMGQGPDGTVLAFDIYTHEKSPGDYLGSLFRSDDGGLSFTGPHDLSVRVNRVMSVVYPTEDHMPEDGHAMRKFYIPLPDYYDSLMQKSSRQIGLHFWRNVLQINGRWLAPMVGRFHADRGYRTILVASEDDGRTWDFVSTIAYAHEETKDGYCEPAMIVAADGSLLCVMRRGAGIPLGQVRSRDGGETWSKPEYLAAHGVDPDLCLMSNGVLACSFGRPGRYVMFSEDGCGYSWGYRTALAEDALGGSCYTGLAEITPGKLLVTYDGMSDATGVERLDSRGRYNQEWSRHGYIASALLTVGKTAAIPER